MESSSPPYEVVCFGEVLWDILSAGALPGGAGAFIATQSGACPQYEIAQILEQINSNSSIKFQIH